jgi:uncharacterized membrane protein
MLNRILAAEDINATAVAKTSANLVQSQTRFSLSLSTHSLPTPMQNRYFYLSIYPTENPRIPYQIHLNHLFHLTPTCYDDRRGWWI